MSIYKSVSLAVFGAILFIFGYMSSIHFEGKKTKELLAEYFERTNDAMFFIMEVNNYESLVWIKRATDKGNQTIVDELINAQGQSLNLRIERLESNFDKIPFQERELIYKEAIERAKLLISENE